MQLSAGGLNERQGHVVQSAKRGEGAVTDRRFRGGLRDKAVR